MKRFTQFTEALKKDSDDPCWKNYVQLGTKKKNGKEVPNCVPKEELELDEAKQYVVIDKRGKVVSSRPMSTSAALDHYDSLGGNAKGYKVVATDDKRIKEAAELEEAKMIHFVAMPLVNKGKLKTHHSTELKAPSAKVAREKAAAEFGLKPDQVKAVAKYQDDAKYNEELEEGITAGELKAQAEGKKAARQGVKYDDNPYEKGSPRHLQWSKGHNSARAGKLGVREEVEIDEALEKDGPNRGKMNFKIPKGEAGKKYQADKAQQRKDMNAKNDPGAAKKGLALSVLDKAKARMKATKKGLEKKISPYDMAVGKKPNKMMMIQKGLAKEEVEIDEVLDTEKARASYVKKAKDSKERAQKKAAANVGSDISKELNTMHKREKGANLLMYKRVRDRARKQAYNESVEIEENQLIKEFTTEQWDLVAEYINENNISYEQLEEMSAEQLDEFIGKAIGGAFKIGAKAAVGAARLAKKGAKKAVYNKQGNVRGSQAAKNDAAQAQADKLRQKRKEIVQKRLQQRKSNQLKKSVEREKNKLAATKARANK